MAFELRNDWLELAAEEIVEPDRPIVDPHHHLFVESPVFPHYTLEDLWADTSGHHVVQTVFAQCGEGYRTDGPEALRPVGETEWVERVAQESERDPERATIGAIFGTADLRLGASVREVLEAHVAASPRFVGIRDIAAWDASDALHSGEHLPGPDLYADPAFRDGFAVLGELGLSFDAYHYHPQTPALTDLAHAFPGVTIVLDHLGTPVGVGPYAGKREEVFEVWSKDLAELAGCPNVHVKLGGLAMPWNGFGYEAAERPPSSDRLLADQGRYYRHAIECFGPDRCMFESNFPVDKLSLSYDVLWNFFKKLVADASDAEKDQLFRGTASRVYKLS